MKRTSFVNDEYYHILCRGTDKRDIFNGKSDYARFLEGLEIYNSHGLSWISIQRKQKEKDTSERLVDVISYCLMPNHYHLLLKQRCEQGITKFMRKLNTGYTMYFNVKYQRVGRLFENSFKSIYVNNDRYLNHLKLYINLNPLDLFNKKWREGKIINIKEALDFINSYPWSSYYTDNKIIKKKDLVSWIGRQFPNLDNRLTLE